MRSPSAHVAAAQASRSHGDPYGRPVDCTRAASDRSPISARRRWSFRLLWTEDSLAKVFRKLRRGGKPAGHLETFIAPAERLKRGFELFDPPDELRPLSGNGFAQMPPAAPQRID